MRMSVVQCGLTLLGLTLVLCSSATSQPDPELRLHPDLRNRRLLQRARALGIAPQDWSRREVQDLLSQLTEVELGARDDDDDGDEGVPGAEVKPEIRVELQRSDDNQHLLQQLLLPPRERKAGCKNFYWKGFTSC